MLRIHNTLTRQIEDFQPLEEGKVRMYVCGMTVYDYCHIGHARAMVTFDMVHRWLKQRGYEVTFVRNHTDVDDKIIARAKETGEDPLALSRRFIAALDEDLAALGLDAPTSEPRVSDNIEGIIDMVKTLVEGGHAYAVDGDVFYSVESWPHYGELSGKKLDDQRAGERVGVDERKRHPGDFALWKAAKPDEISWDSPWGKGRPGWHIECSVMSVAALGPTFDIHGGGIDLVFPHHENEIAQSEAATGHRPFARTWMHNGHLTMESGKMSKSLGNIIRIRDILEQVPAEALRVLFLDGHYRSPLPYSSSRLEEALAGLDRVYQAKELLEAMAERPVNEDAKQLIAAFGEPAEEAFALAEGFAERFHEAMDDDFNSARALSLLFDLARAVNRLAYGKPKVLKRGAALARPALEAYALCGRVLGIGELASDVWFSEVRQKRLKKMGKSEADIEARLRDRAAARASKDFAKADAIRDELAAMGVVMMDTPQGTSWRMQIAGE